MSKIKLNVSKQLKKSLKEKGSKKILKYLKYLQINNFFKKEKHSIKVYKFLKKLEDNLFKELDIFIKNNSYSKSKKKKTEEYSSCSNYSSCR